jgi:general secretion pathway protein G
MLMLMLRPDPHRVFDKFESFMLPLSPICKTHNTHTTQSRGSRGFTLLELLVVMVIIGLLAGYVGPKFFGQIGKSEVKATRAQIDGLQKSLDQYRLDVGRYPSTEQGLAVLVSKPSDEPRWAGPYLSKAVPKDPWKNDYQYRSPGEHGEYDLLSYGRDGRPGGEGEDADLVSW